MYLRRMGALTRPFCHANNGHLRTRAMLAQYYAARLVCGLGCLDRSATLSFVPGPQI